MKYVENFKSRPYIVWLLGLIYLGCLVSLVCLIIFQLPVPAPKDSREFSESRAREDLDYLSGVIGPHPIGSFENRKLTVDYLFDQLSTIKKSAVEYGNVVVSYNFQNNTGSVKKSIIKHILAF
jgi:hypothetical protein